MYIISILKSGRERCSSPRLSKYFIFSLPNYCSIKNYTYLCTRNHKGAIAQLVEQRTENPCVPGSIPGGTTFQKQSECSAVGSALRSGRRGRAFESPHSDRRRQTSKIGCRFFFFTFTNRCKSAENFKNFILVFCSIIHYINL